MITFKLRHHSDLENQPNIEILPSAKNRTTESNYVFYTKTPKCGSTTMLRLLQSLMIQNDFEARVMITVSQNDQRAT